ncbi:MAG: hypothetical protein IPF69_02440 [Chitinophagaceae bacterium]|jgi:hypothetical protein|nr:hypothetical protein [Chitinophagaceae bacterium]MBK9465677.1 hypothetical protein [Chitinophagaceae bacterium]MBL0068741.1 hypothetical protein [Chitinophagaceae bacterium]MBP6417077.1 hypothetical protein [Chitinophagaceae bacterium]HQV62276.1 hypothetical protein [Chitinophagaceae bacterium]
MQLVKLITPKRIKTLHCLFLTILVLFLTTVTPVFSQDNSPYSRYGIGDLVPSTPVTNRGMGGISAGYTDFLSVNFSNPASYSSFQAVLEPKSKKLVSGRAIFDVGLNFENRTLREPPPSTAQKFTASNALFSYIQVGVPIKNNWGLSFGLRPISRISYNILRSERLKDPLTGLPIDSARTNYTGTGGSYLASVGTGFSLFSKVRESKNKMVEALSIGFNAGYYFGAKDYSSRRSLINDTIDYYQANYETKTNYGSLFFNAGLQYKVPLNKKILFTIGAYGNWGQKINATQDVLRETFLYDENVGYLRLDSVSDRRNVKGKIEIPSSYTIGFVAQKAAISSKEGGWLIGLDFTQQNWSQYRFYGQTDSVRNKWEVKVGGQFNPIPKRNYFSNVAYRVGFFMGPDYIQVKEKMMQFGASFGLGLPVALSRQAPNQVTLVNLAFEYGKRGNNDNLLKENMFRFSLGFSLSDFWFIKRKYD